MGIDENKIVNIDVFCLDIRYKDWGDGINFLIIDLLSKLSCFGFLNIIFRFLILVRFNLF